MRALSGRSRPIGIAARRLGVGRKRGAQALACRIGLRPVLAAASQLVCDGHHGDDAGKRQKRRPEAVQGKGDRHGNDQVGNRRQHQHALPEQAAAFEKTRPGNLAGKLQVPVVEAVGKRLHLRAAAAGDVVYPYAAIAGTHGIEDDTHRHALQVVQVAAGNIARFLQIAQILARLGNSILHDLCGHLGVIGAGRVFCSKALRCLLAAFAGFGQTSLEALPSNAHGTLFHQTHHAGGEILRQGAVPVPQTADNGSVQVFGKAQKRDIGFPLHLAHAPEQRIHQQCESGEQDGKDREHDERGKLAQAAISLLIDPFQLFLQHFVPVERPRMLRRHFGRCIADPFGGHEDADFRVFIGRHDLIPHGDRIHTCIEVEAAAFGAMAPAVHVLAFHGLRIGGNGQAHRAGDVLGCGRPLARRNELPAQLGAVLVQLHGAHDVVFALQQHVFAGHIEEGVGTPVLFVEGIHVLGRHFAFAPLRVVFRVFKRDQVQFLLIDGIHLRHGNTGQVFHGIAAGKILPPAQVGVVFLEADHALLHHMQGTVGLHVRRNAHALDAVLAGIRVAVRKGGSGRKHAGEGDCEQQGQQQGQRGSQAASPRKSAGYPAVRPPCVLHDLTPCKFRGLALICIDAFR